MEIHKGGGDEEKRVRVLSGGGKGGGGELTHFPIRKSGSGVDPHLDSRVE